ncbi:hypothetical protein TSUD_136900 [Trifolium subterraneum]|uniref:Reverse transcriptase domain-containing protein n=1 Tax=Trifolium subterraneum TaxID=3900 RepID=A0A2Z6NC13_TRISU|nr:hypothetical protein TSUD_136900 [Trifolium subterraneum]
MRCLKLEAHITKEEINIALSQMHSDKSPGPDGFNSAFFQKFWNLCGDEVLANRLKTCLGKCVSEEQSAFVQGRSILDNALIAIEIIHYLKRKSKGAKGELALKIDISKAYDKVEWRFLKGVLMRMRFSEKLVHWMMLCVSSINYSQFVNFDKIGMIHLGRGLRQGDPLSPYLFILLAEVLTSLIKKAMDCGDLHGVKICIGAPMVSHLLFANDYFLFCSKAMVELICKPNAMVSRLFKARWVIGDNEVMDDPWLRVNDGRWVGAEAKAILDVPLLYEVHEDRLIWNEERDDLYSVRSGYRKLMEERLLTNMDTVTATLCSMPTGMSFMSSNTGRGLTFVIGMWGYSKEAWNVMGLESIITPRLHLFHNIKDLILDVCSKESKEAAGKTTMLLWTIWHNRNNNVWNNVKVSARHVGMQAANLWNDWARANDLVAAHNSTTARQNDGHSQDHWKPPRQGYEKCNIDASSFESIDKTGWGWCIRDHHAYGSRGGQQLCRLDGGSIKVGRWRAIRRWQAV